MKMTGRLSGKVAIVTGAASQRDGIGNGKAAAILFAREGATVVLVNRSIERAEQLSEEITREGGKSSVFACDVGNPENVSEMVRETIARHRKIDILHCNAGISGMGKIEDLDSEVLQKNIHTNILGTIYPCKFVIPHMVENGGGSIIVVSSIAAVVGLTNPRGNVAYSATKAAGLGLARSIAAEHAANGIRVNCIVVGLVETPMVANLGTAELEKRRLSVPLRTKGTGWDVGWAAVYLASEESRWVTGAFIPVDGGRTGVQQWY